MRLEYEDLSDFTKGCVDAILNGANFESIYPGALSFIVKECANFDMSNKTLLNQHYLCKFYEAGQDYWNTRQNIKPVPVLKEACKKYPPLYVLYSLDGKIYL